MKIWRLISRALLVAILQAAAPVAVLVNATPALAQYEDSFTLPNGQRVRATDPAGQRGKQNPDGSVTYPDGTTVSVGWNDRTVITRPDGSTRSSAAPDTFELPNGQEVRATDPDGRRGKQHPDGSVTYPDGTTVGMDGHGNTVVNRGDGSSSTHDAPPKRPGEGGGPIEAYAEGRLTLPNGEVVPARGPDGAPGTLQPDGSMHYGDGTVISGPEGEKTRITHPDGTSSDYHARSGWPIVDPFSASGARAQGNAGGDRQRRFRAGSGFPANPVEDTGVFRFDLRLVQFVDSRRAKGKFTQYVNSGDGTVALFNPDQTILDLGGQSLPDVAIHFLLMRPGGTWLVCGRHKDYGEACARTGGANSTHAGQLTLLHAMHDWFDSIRRVDQTAPATTPGTRPESGARALRGKFPGGQTLTLWRSPRPSQVITHIPWLGFGAGLYKDYPVSENRIAQVVAAEGADLGGGNVLFKLLEHAPEQRSFDTRRYRQVTAFSTKALSQATTMGLQIMGEIPAKMADIERALAACPKGRAGKTCRERYRAERRTLEEEVRQRVRSWAEGHGLPLGAR